MRRSLSAIALAITIGLSLIGCGRSESSAEDVMAVLDRAFVDFDADACTEILTERMLEQLQVDGDQDPLQACIEDAEEPGANADAIAVDELDVTGDEASATVTPEGGDSDGAAFELALLDEEGWQIDRIVAMEIIDRARYIDATFSDLADDGSFNSSQARCMKRWIESHVEDAELERMFPGKDISFIYDATRACVGDGTDAGAISVLLRQALVDEQGLSGRQAACVVRRLQPVIRGHRIDDFDEVTDEPAFQNAAAAAGVICVGPEGPEGAPPLDPV